MWTTVTEPYKVNEVLYCDCICSCGTERRVKYHNLLYNLSKSCGCTKGNKLIPILERFEDKFVCTPECCWVWNGSTDKDGYGIIKETIDGKRFIRKAHRVSWFKYNGEIPENLCVLHKCDNPPCVNPDHLFLGTQAENQFDRKYKGRSGYGERNGRAVLKDEEILEIRRLGKCLTQTMIAEKFNVTQTTIRNILNRKLWKHL